MRPDGRTIIVCRRRREIGPSLAAPIRLEASMQVLFFPLSALRSCIRTPDGDDLVHGHRPAAVLILLNGVLAMSEIAVVSSRRAQLQKLADDGSPAQSALSLHTEPSNFLSAIQVGITSVGILSGAIGETVLADPLAARLAEFTPIAPYARGIALTLVVVGLTYFSVVIGELVPKRLALRAPEGIASLIARPMMWFAESVRPLVWLFTASSGLLLRLAGARHKEEPPVTDEEINVLMEQGAEAGVFHESEQAIVSNVLRLDDQRIGAIMTHRKDIYLIDLDEPEEETRRRIADCPYTRIVVCRNGLEHIVGLLRTADLLKAALSGAPLNVDAHLRPPLYVPEGVSTTRLLENFRKARAHWRSSSTSTASCRGWSR
jgi:putative hemolysin